MGDPTERDPLLVAQDVRDGLVSPANARALYRVALTKDCAVDTADTARMRLHKRR
jgi:N-methylhydantoinase B/oxoprolinase/acetone carboxylase alpha subunit